MSRKVVAGPADGPPGTLRGIEVADGTLLCVARTAAGWRAIDDSCNHAGGLLSGGWLERGPGAREMVVCPCHEAGFDAETGRNLTSPELCGDQAAFPVEVVDGMVIVTLPDGEPR